MALLQYTRTTGVISTILGRNKTNKMKVAVRNLMSKQLYYKKFGEPLDVVKIREVVIPPLGSQDVLVRMLAAPVNPADINTIQGLIAPKPPLPRVPGDEGVGEIVEVGCLVNRVKPGDRVIVTTPLLGTWSYYGKFDEQDVYRVSSKIDLPELAMLSRSPCTAYRLLKDIVKLCPGDILIQNGAQSAVGQSVIQLCHHWNIKTINIVSSHYGYDVLKKHLKKLGASKVFTLEEIEELNTLQTSLGRPKLALNSLSGRYERVLLKLLDRYGTMVNHGGAYKNSTSMSKRLRPDVCIYNFSIDEWIANTHCMYRDAMMKEIVQLMAIGKFTAPIHQIVELRSYIHAFKNTAANEGFSSVNYVFDFTKA